MFEREQVKKILKQVKPMFELEGVKTIIDDGYLESMELMMLIASLCEEFDIEIGVDEIAPENFNSIDQITEMVIRLKG